MKYITTPALALLIAATPLAAMAEVVNVDVRADADVRAEGKAPMFRLDQGFQGFFGGARQDMSEKKRDMASTTRPEKADGTRAGAAVSARIDTRIDSLNSLIDRIENTDRLSDATKASLTAMLTAQVEALTEVRATATTTTKGMLHAYALVMPKAAITAAADRIMTIVGNMEALSVKAEARIDAAANAGTDVAAARTALADFDMHVAEASADARAAVSLVADISVTADETGVSEEIRIALKDAKAKITSAHEHLREARKSFASFLTGIKGKGVVYIEVR